MHLTLKRLATAHGAVVGVLTGLPVTLYTLEDQWRDNQRGVSCILPGFYEVHPHGWEADTPFRFKRVWQLQKVRDRAGILIHAGNYHTNTEGCILVGMGLQISRTQAMVNDSQNALEYLRKTIGERGFTISIEGYGE